MKLLDSESAGIQMFNNDDSRCPERHGGTNHTKLYIDSSVPLLNVSSVWREDSSLSMSCYTYYTKVSSSLLLCAS